MDPIRSVASLALALAVLAPAAPAPAEDGARARFGRGVQHLGFSAGYGVGFSLGFTGDGDTRDVEFAAVLPSWQIGISDLLWEESRLRGSFDFVFEPQVLVSTQPRSGIFAGPTVLLRYNFLAGERWVPYLEVGGGFGYLDFDLVDQSDGFSFVVQAGAGLRYLVARNLSLDAGYRFHHISNAGTRSPNNGINANMPLLGMTLYLD